MITRPAALALVLGLCTTACGAPHSSAGTGTRCSITSCRFTLARRPGATADVLGVRAELVSVRSGLVTLNIAGQPVSLSAAGDPRTSTDGFVLSVRSTARDHVVISITRR